MARHFIKRLISCAAAAGLALPLCLAPAFSQSSDRDESWRKTPPSPAPLRPFRLPAVRDKKLPNGMTLVMIEDHQAPLVTMQVRIPVGDVNDPAAQPGLSEATARLLTDGAGTRNSEQIAREVESLGGLLSAGSGTDFTTVSASVISGNYDRIMDVFADVVLRPTFPEEEVALYRNNRIQNLMVERQDPSFLAAEEFSRVIYGPHPYSITSPTQESVSTMDREKIQAFYRSSYGPAGAVLTVTGDFDPVKAEARIQSLFGKWKAPEAVSRKYPSMPERSARRIYLVDRPGSEQADIRMGNLGLTRTDPDFYSLLVANAILGGGTASRLFMNIREKKGFTYDISSALSLPGQRGTFFVATETRNDAALPAIKEILAEFERMRNEKVSAEDLRTGKNLLSGTFSLTLSTQSGISDLIGKAYLLGLGTAYLENYRNRIEAVTPEQIQEAARKYILSDRLAIVVVGDAKKLRKDLESVAAVEVVGLDGKAVKE